MSYARKSVSRQDIDSSCAHADNRVSAEPFQVPVPNRVQHAFPISYGPAGYDAVKTADEEDGHSPAEKDARPRTVAITESRMASPLLGSSSSHIAVYDNPFSDAAPSAPPVPPRPPPFRRTFWKAAQHWRSTREWGGRSGALNAVKRDARCRRPVGEKSASRGRGTPRTAGSGWQEGEIVAGRFWMCTQCTARARCRRHMLSTIDTSIPQDRRYPILLLDITVLFVA